VTHNKPRPVPPQQTPVKNLAPPREINASGGGLLVALINASHLLGKRDRQSVVSSQYTAVRCISPTLTLVLSHLVSIPLMALNSLTYILTYLLICAGSVKKLLTLSHAHTREVSSISFYTATSLHQPET